MNIIETPKTTSECMEQLKRLRSDLSLPTLRSYAAKSLIPKSKHTGGGRGAESWWHAETVPEAVAASRLLESQRMNFEGVVQIRKIARHIEKIIVVEDIQKALFQDPRVGRFTTDQVKAFRLASWLQHKWRAMKQLDLIREPDIGSRRPEPYHHMQAVRFLVHGPIVSILMDIAEGKTEPTVGKLANEEGQP